VILTKTITKSCQTSITAVNMQSSSAGKRNTSRSSASATLSATIWDRIGKVTLGYLIFLLA
jgi:hypothetical protein